MNSKEYTPPFPLTPKPLTLLAVMVACLRCLVSQFLWVIILTSLGPPSICAQVSPETRRQLLDDFQQKNRESQEPNSEQEPQEPSVDSVGLDTLKQELADARLKFYEDKSRANRDLLNLATLRYADPLIRLERNEEALEVLNSSMKMGADGKDLSVAWIDLMVRMGEIALEAGYLQDARIAFDEAWRKARQEELTDREDQLERMLRDVLFDWARQNYSQGAWADARSQCIEALTWRLDEPPIYAMLARIDYQFDLYEEARGHIRFARLGALRDSPFLASLADLIEIERNLESRFRKLDLKETVLAYPVGFVINEAELKRSFDDAKKGLSDMFGLSTELPLRVSLYQRGDYLRLLGAADWSAAATLFGKLRLKLDLVTGPGDERRVITRYAYALWLLDILTDGRAPAWFQEGVAHQFAFPEGPANHGMLELKKRVEQSEVLPFSELIPPTYLIPDRLDAAVVLTQSQGAVQVLIDRQGIGAVKAYADALARNPDPEAALRQVFGFGYDDLFEEWSTWSTRTFPTKTAPDRVTLSRMGRVSPIAYWDQ